MRKAVAIATEQRPFVGHKSAPLICRWPGFSWWRYNVPEIMHDIKNLCDSFVRLLIGKTTNYAWNRDSSHRVHAKKLDVFPDIWPGVDGALPWRLTREQRLLLDRRTGNIVWPHYVEPLYYRGASFWRKPSRMWKSRRKYRLFLYILPVLLRDQLPKLREAFLLLASVLRRLDGQVCSFEEAKSLSILPGSRVLCSAEIDAIGKDLVRALVLFEGCVPITYLIPSTHHLVHYAAYMKTHDILRVFWMMSFERFFSPQITKI